MKFSAPPPATATKLNTGLENQLKDCVKEAQREETQRPRRQGPDLDKLLQVGSLEMEGTGERRVGLVNEKQFQIEKVTFK